MTSIGSVNKGIRSAYFWNRTLTLSMPRVIKVQVRQLGLINHLLQLGWELDVDLAYTMPVVVDHRSGSWASSITYCSWACWSIFCTSCISIRAGHTARCLVAGSTHLSPLDLQRLRGLPPQALCKRPSHIAATRPTILFIAPNSNTSIRSAKPSTVLNSPQNCLRQLPLQPSLWMSPRRAGRAAHLMQRPRHR